MGEKAAAAAAAEARALLVRAAQDRAAAMEVLTRLGQLPEQAAPRRAAPPHDRARLRAEHLAWSPCVVGDRPCLSALIPGPPNPLLMRDRRAAPPIYVGRCCCAWEGDLVIRASDGSGDDWVIPAGEDDPRGFAGS